jgi:hypothetical protein
MKFTEITFTASRFLSFWDVVPHHWLRESMMASDSRFDMFMKYLALIHLKINSELILKESFLICLRVFL